MNPRIFYTFFTILVAFCVVGGNAWARDAAGKVVHIKGRAWVQVGVARNMLETGAVVYTNRIDHLPNELVTW